jgi:hypothetical protein
MLTDIIFLYALFHFFGSLAILGCASDRDRSQVGWFFLALFLGPIFAALCLIACGDTHKRRRENAALLAAALRPPAD